MSETDDIKAKLDALAELQDHLTSLRLQYEDRLVELMGPEVAARVNEARAVFELQAALLGAEIQGTEETVRLMVLAAG